MNRIRVGRQSATLSLKLCLCVFWILLSLTVSSIMGAQTAMAAVGVAGYHNTQDMPAQSAQVTAESQSSDANLPLTTESRSSDASLPFSDVQAWQWHSAIVTRAFRAGILEGYPDGTFRPDHLVTCGEFLRMTMGCAPEMNSSKNETAFEEDQFEDEQSQDDVVHWALPHYMEGLQRGLFTGADIQKSALDRPISRKVMALVYSRLMEDMDGVRVARDFKGTVPRAPFFDVGGDSLYEYPISVAAAVGLLAGYPDGSFRPESSLTRAEAAAGFVRLLDLVDEAGGGPLPGEQLPDQHPGEQLPDQHPGEQLPDQHPGDQPSDQHPGEHAPNQPPVPSPPETPSLGGPHAPASPAPGSSEPDVRIADIADRTCFAYLDQFLATVRFEGSAGNYRYRFDAPALPEGYRNMISMSFFSPTGQKILTQYNYWSREASAHSVVVPMPALKSPKELGTVLMEISTENLATGNMLGYTLTHRIATGNNLRIQHLTSATRAVLTEHYPGVLSNTFVWK